MTETITLEASIREITGKKVKRLRQAGQIPAVVYGPGFENINIAILEGELRQTLIKAGGTQIIELNVGKEKIPTLAKKVQRDPLRGNLIHADFYRVAMDRTIRAEVPIVLVNEPDIVASNEAIATQLLASVEIEALPADLIPQIEVDISALGEIGAQLLVGELEVPDTVTITADPDELILKLDYAQALEEEEEEELLEEVLEADEVEVITERKEEEVEEE